MQGKVKKLFITHNDIAKTRESVDAVEVDPKGIKIDKFYGTNEERSVLITSTQSYDMALNQGIELSHGALGENILIDINPYHLLAGDRFTIGKVEFEITQNCTLCKGLSSVNSKLPKLLKNDRGIFAKVISTNGYIQKGDGVEI